jgi:hypothetical protein
MIYEHGGIVDMDLDWREKPDSYDRHSEDENQSVIEQNPSMSASQNEEPWKHEEHESCQSSPISAEHSLENNPSQEKENIVPSDGPVSTEPLNTPDVRSNSSLLTPMNTIEGVSRFYVTKKVVVGNVSRYVPPGMNHDRFG